MNKQNISLIIMTLFLALLLANCGSEEVVPPTDEPVAMVETAVPTETAVLTQPAPTQPAPTPTVEVVVEEVTVDVPVSNLTDSCVTEYDEAVNYFPDQTELTETDDFTVEYFNNYKVVTVAAPYSGAEEAVQYVLVQCGTLAPEGFDDAVIIEVPISSIVAMSTTYLPALEALDLLDTLVGVDTGLYVTSEAVRSMIDAGDVVEIGSGADVNVETAVDLDPDLIMAYASGAPDYDAHPKLQEAGLTVALNAEYLETSPLGRAEWVDFIALFYNEEAAAEAWFAEMATDYEAMVALTADLSERPTVFANTPFDGTWYMPGGDSYIAQLFTDAGAEFVWADDESTSSLYLDFETVFEQASEADFWLNIGYFGSLGDLAAADERFTEFAAYQNGRVFNNDARTNENGGSDYYESGVVYPNLILADLIKIFHPDLLPDHQFVYHQPVE